MVLERLKAFGSKSLARFVARGSVTRNITLIAGGTVIGQAATLVVLPLLTRLYTPADFGAMAIFLALLVPLNAVASLRYEMAIPLPDDEHDAQHLLMLSLVIVIVLSALLAVLVVLFARPLLVRINGTALLGYLWLLPLALLGGGCYHALSHYAIRVQAFRTIAQTKITQGVGQGLSQALLGLTGIGLLGLLLGLLVRFWGGMVALVKLVLTDRRHRAWQLRWNTLKQVAVTYQRFPLFSSGGTFLQVASSHLPAFFLAASFTPQIAGWFSLGQRVLEAPITFLAKSSAQVYLSEASAATRTGGNLRPLLRATLRRQSSIGLLLVLGVMLPAPWLFPWLFGEAWAVSGRYVQVMSLAFFSQFLVQTVTAETLAITGQQHWQLVGESLRVVSVVVVFLLSRQWERDALWTVTTYALVSLVLYVFQLTVTWWSAGRTSIYVRE